MLYVASDDPGMAERFARWRPRTERDLGPPLPGLGFLGDFAVLRAADLVAVSNSSFSFTATMLNETARVFVRPDPLARRLVPYDPWDAPVLLDQDQASTST